MPLISLILALAILGLILYLINTFIPMDPKFKMIINVIVVIILCIWLLQFVGFNPTIPVHR